MTSLIDVLPARSARALIAPLAALTLLLAGCSAPGRASVAEQPLVVRSSPTVRTVTPVSSRTGADALPYWTNRLATESSRDAALLGLGAIYSNQTATYQTYPFVGTLGKTCLVLVGYDPKYSEYPLNRIPTFDVAIFNRFGFTEDRGRLVFESASKNRIKAVLASRRGRCM